MIKVFKDQEVSIIWTEGDFFIKMNDVETILEKPICLKDIKSKLILQSDQYYFNKFGLYRTCSNAELIEWYDHIIVDPKFKHDILMHTFLDKSVVYFGYTDNTNGKVNIKIGSTNKLEQQHNLQLFNVLETPLCEDFEKYLHKHKMIKPFKDQKVDISYIDTIIDIARRNHGKFLNKTIKYEKTMGTEAIIKPRIVTVNRGSKIQIYNPETKELVHTFNSLIECMRDNDIISECSKPMMVSAIKTKSIYKNYIWMNLDRSLPDDHVQDLGDNTDVTKSVNIGFVAMLNLDKTCIEKVYANMKLAHIDRKLKCTAAISKAIRIGTKSSGHYFKMWEECDEGLKNDFLSRDKLPDKPHRFNCVIVNKLDANTKEIITTYSRIEDIIREYKIARKTLYAALEFGYICKGFRWENQTI